MAKGSDQRSGDPTEPGWYPDPWSATGDGERYFDGTRWGTTEKPLARHTVVTVEPGDAPAPGRFRRAIVPVLVLVALVGAYFAVSRMTGSDDSSGEQTEVTDAPPPSAEEASKPLGTPAPVPAGSGKHEFTDVQASNADRPVAFDPCRPIHYVVNPKKAPPDGQELIANGIARVSEATGLRFVADGPTTEVRGKHREPYQPKRYGKDQWAPVLITWSDASADPELGGYISGVTSKHGVAAPNGTVVYVTGEVTLDGEQLAAGGTGAESTVLHELGHLVGLAHTNDRTQLMYAEGQPDVTDFGAGDLRGLAMLGRGACVPGV